MRATCLGVGLLPPEKNFVTFYMTFQGVTVLNKIVLLEEKHFNTFNSDGEPRIKEEKQKEDTALPASV